MNKNEFESVQNFSYNDYCEYLLSKYGKVPYDYFSLSFNRNRENSRTNEGLFIHHIAENKIANLSDVEIAKQNSFDYQKAEKLLYCDWLEHIWLHILIGKEDPSGNLGLNGARMMIDTVENLYNGEDITIDWIKNCFDRIKDEEETFDLISQELYNCEKSYEERIVLFEHNEQIYNELELYLENDNKALVLLGTGLGKTTTALEYLKRHNIRGLVICPTNIIRSTWDAIPEVDTLTYAGFSNKYENIDYSQYGAVILDEAHHCGGATWGKGPRYLIENNIVKVIGLTATNIRTDGKDIGETLFGGNICRGLNVLEGIEQGILHPFSYVGAIYDTESIREEYHSKNLDEELLGELDLALNNTPTLKKIFTDNMPIGPRKGIIFVSNIAAIDEAMAIMKDIYPDVEYRAIHSMMNENEVETNKKWFANTEEGYLISINMVSEGAHYRGVNTLIMFRRTCSSLVFNQQLGRVIALAKYENPNAIVFDLVNNAKVIQEFKPFLVELRETINRKQNNYSNINKSEQLIIKDYCDSIINILEKIQNGFINPKIQIYQINPLSFDIVHEFCGVNEAQRYFGRLNSSSISACLCGKRFSAYGFCWCKKDEWNQSWRPKKKKLRRAVYQIDKITLQPIKLFDSIKEAAEYTNGSRGGILQCCRRMMHSSSNFYWAYYEDYSDDWEPVEASFERNLNIYCFETKEIYKNVTEASEKTGANKSHILRVAKGYENAANNLHFCYLKDKDSFTIKENQSLSACVCINTQKEYSSIKEASEDTGCNASKISACCTKEQKTTYSTILNKALSWCYKVDYNKNMRPNKPLKKAVRCIETQKIYESASEAARQCNLSSSTISACCRGKQKTTGKLHWEFVDEKN